MWFVIAGIILGIMFCGILYLIIKQKQQEESCKLCQKAPWFKKEMCEGCIKNTGHIEDLLER